jgi:flagellar biosynthetic protein FliQ
MLRTARRESGGVASKPEETKRDLGFISSQLAFPNVRHVYGPARRIGELGIRGIMEADRALSLMKAMLWQSMVVAGPVLAAALIVGLLISVFQVATQLQEMTLSYVPKLFASAVVLMVLGPWMIHRVTQFAVAMIAMIPELG